MAKIPFSKIDLKVSDMIKQGSYINSKGEEIVYEVKFYLPVEEKLQLVSNIINQSIDDHGFYNPIRVQIFTVLEVVYAYTNFNFTDKQKENPFKLYDILIATEIFKTVIDLIYEDDWKEIQEAVLKTIDNIYKYKNSAMGIMEIISADYSELNLDAQNIQKALADPENMTLLKDILTKLG